MQLWEGTGEGTTLDAGNSSNVLYSRQATVTSPLCVLYKRLLRTSVSQSGGDNVLLGNLCLAASIVGRRRRCPTSGYGSEAPEFRAMSDFLPVTSHTTDFILLVADVIRHNALLTTTTTIIIAQRNALHHNASDTSATTRGRTADNSRNYTRIGFVLITHCAFHVSRPDLSFLLQVNARSCFYIKENFII